MKKIILILLLAVITSCKAQSPEVNVLEWDYIMQPNIYLKDVADDMSSFTGTYIFDNGNIYFKVQLKKIPMVYSGYLYEDLLVGEFEYRVNGVTLVNTLPMFNQYEENPYRHAIRGSLVVNNDYYPVCNDCAPNEKRMSVGFNDTKRAFNLIIRKMMVGSSQALKFSFKYGGESVIQGQTPVVPYIQEPEYILIKQP